MYQIDHNISIFSSGLEDPGLEPHFSALNTIPPNRVPTLRLNDFGPTPSKRATTGQNTKARCTLQLAEPLAGPTKTRDFPHKPLASLLRVHDSKTRNESSDGQRAESLMHNARAIPWAHMGG